NDATLLLRPAILLVDWDFDPAGGVFEADAPDDVRHVEHLAVVEQRQPGAGADGCRPHALPAGRPQMRRLDSDERPTTGAVPRTRLAPDWRVHRHHATAEERQQAREHP